MQNKVSRPGAPQGKKDQWTGGLNDGTTEGLNDRRTDGQYIT